MRMAALHSMLLHVTRSGCGKMGKVDQVQAASSTWHPTVQKSGALVKDRQQTGSK